MAASDHEKKKKAFFPFFHSPSPGQGTGEGSGFASFFLGPGMTCVFRYILVDIYNFGLLNVQAHRTTFIRGGLDGLKCRREGLRSS